MFHADTISVHLQDRPILSNLSFRLDRGCFVGLLGPNGAGKSMLLKTLCGLLVPTEGKLEFQGQALSSLGPAARGQAMAYMPQLRASAWPMKVRDIVALGRIPHLTPFSRLSSADTKAIEAALKAGHAHAFIDRPLNTLSGGEQGRVFLARALAVQAPVLLCDEPISGLDPYHQITMMEVLHHQAQQGRLVITALHDLALAARFCDRILLLQEGELYADGPPEEALGEDNLEQVYRVKTARLQGMPIAMEVL